MPESSVWTISAALPAHARVLSRIAFEAKASWGYSEEFMQACADEIKVTAADLARDDLCYYIAMHQHEVIGFYAIKFSPDSAPELEALFVSPQHFGKGVGRALLEHALKQLGVLNYPLMMVQSDPHALEFYLACGSKLTGSRASESIAERFLPVLTFEVGSG